jgi:HEAT repeat protein
VWKDSRVLEFFAPRVRRLQRRGDVAGLVGALASSSARVRRVAANALVERSDLRAVEPLTKALRDDDELVRANAALALGELEDRRPETPVEAAVEPLIGALGDESPTVRAMASSALGRRRDPRAVEPLERLLQDDDEVVRHTAAAVLHAFRAP